MSVSPVRSGAGLAVALASLRFASLTHGQTPVYFVDDDSPPGGDGLSWETAFADLQDALAMFRKSGGSAEIDVAQGVYHPDRGTGDRSASFDCSVASGTLLRLFGGFAGIKAMIPGARDPAQYLTVLSGDLKGDDAGGFEHAADNSRHVLYAANNGALWIDGCTVTGGFAEYGNLPQGGGLFTYNGALRLSRCRFSLNQAAGLGGAVHALAAKLDIEASVFEVNRAGYGAGAFLAASKVRIVSSRVSLNSATDGGGLLLGGEECAVVECEFRGNHAGKGGALYSDAGVRAVNCTFGANTATGSGAAIWNKDGPAELYNSIVWGNHSDHTGDLISLSRVQDSCIEGGWLDWGNIDADPQFRDPVGPDAVPGTGDEDLRLSAGSPCIDAASNLELPEDWFDLDADGDEHEPLSLDLAGNPRRVDDPFTVDSGIGPAPVVDMGAYEFQTFCPADFDSDGVLTLFDFLAFVNAFNAGEASADCTADGLYDLFDFLCFTNAFNEGC